MTPVRNTIFGEMKRFKFEKCAGDDVNVGELVAIKTEVFEGGQPRDPVDFRPLRDLVSVKVQLSEATQRTVIKT